MSALRLLLGRFGTLPRIEQVFVDAGAEQDEAAFTLALFLARRRSEQQLREHADYYVTTLSPNAISYKGMVLPDKLSRFYVDLQRNDLASSAIVFHQRFSTNTLPRWPLAHPFRMLAHNGEINTIEGNRRWAQARSKVWKTPRFDIGEFNPVISMHGSDSQSLDNMLELMVSAGMELIQALRILVPLGQVCGWSRRCVSSAARSAVLATLCWSGSRTRQRTRRW